MKVRKTKDIKKTLLLKGFILEPSKDHHDFYYLQTEGKKHNVYTYLSHGSKEYGTALMSMMKKQLKFRETNTAEDFFDCPLSKEDYVKMVKEDGHV